MTKAKVRIDDLGLAFVVLLVLPLAPLIFELAIKMMFKPNAPELLEPGSVMITASLFAASVGIASRFKSIFLSGLIVTCLLAVVYGGKAMQAAPETHTVVQAQQAHSETHEKPPSFTSKIGFDDRAEKFAWIMIGIMGVVLLIERVIRHGLYAEPFEFEWSKTP